jgi:hypothetical protein
MYLNMLGLGVAPLVQIALFGLSLREAVTSPEAAGTTGKASGQGPDSAAQGSFAVDPLATAR